MSIFKRNYQYDNLMIVPEILLIKTSKNQEKIWFLLYAKNIDEMHLWNSIFN